MLVTAGAVYATLALESALAWEPTTTFQTKPLPTPATLLHVIVVSAVVTTQPVAEYVVPVAPYDAVTGLPVVGPKLVPLSVTVVPPAVGIDAPPPIPVTTGGTYAVVPLDEDALV